MNKWVIRAKKVDTLAILEGREYLNLLGELDWLQNALVFPHRHEAELALKRLTADSRRARWSLEASPA